MTQTRLRPGLRLRLTVAGLASWLLVIASPASVQAFQHIETNGPATLTARTDTDRAGMTLSDVLHVVITLEGGKGLRVEAPVRLAANSAWETLSISTVDVKQNPDGRWQQTLTLVPTTPGQLKLELTPLVLRDNGDAVQTLTWKPIAVTVETQIKEIDPRQARDITATEDIPLPPTADVWFWLWLAAAPAGLVVVAAIVILLRRRAAPTPASALRKALHECDRLVALQLAPNRQGKHFVVLLTGIVRRYLERRFDLPARRQTTTELLQSIDARTDLDDEARQWLHTFFAEVDLVRYAGGESEPERRAELVEQVRRFCKATAVPADERLN
jgi:hypothetical protein